MGFPRHEPLGDRGRGSLYDPAMRLGPLRVEARCDVRVPTAPITGTGPVRIGPLEVDVAEGGGWPGLSWALSNRGDNPVAVRSVSIVFGLEDTAPPVRMFRHGYQSWSPSGVATLGVDRDPSAIRALRVPPGPASRRPARRDDRRRAALGVGHGTSRRSQGPSAGRLHGGHRARRNAAPAAGRRGRPHRAAGRGLPGRLPSSPPGSAEPCTTWW